MSETTATPPAATPPAAAPAPVAPPPPAASPPQGPTSPASATSPAEEPKVGEPGWLKGRLDRAAEKAKKETRKELKVERRAVKAAGEEAAKVKAAAEADLAAAKNFADALLAQVPEAERAAIAKAGGSTVAGILQAFSVWQSAKGGTTPAPPAAPTTTAAPQTAAPVAAPIAAPATTAPPPAPPPPAPGAPEDVRRTYEDLRTVNPYLAAQYLLNNQDTVFPDRTIDQVKQQQRR